jgi:hypothetical protein
MGGCRSPASRTRAAWGSRGGAGRQLLRRGLRRAAVRCGRPLRDGSGGSLQMALNSCRDVVQMLDVMDLPEVEMGVC